MPMTPVAARLYDKVDRDAREFRDWAGSYVTTQTSSGFVYSGTAIDLFWQNARNQLREFLSDYFEWIEREAKLIEPTSLRRETVDQCIGATVSLSRRVRQSANDVHCRMLGIASAVDQGNWLDLDDAAISQRGQRLLEGLGLSANTRWMIKWTHWFKDYPWFLGLFSIALALAALGWNIYNTYQINNLAKLQNQSVIVPDKAIERPK
jgi:hypothetical protein